MASRTAAEGQSAGITRRRAVAFGAAVAGGALVMGGIAFACTPIQGYMKVQRYNAATQSVVGSASETTGEGGSSMTFCSGGITGGAEAWNDPGRDATNPSQGGLIKIDVAPATCGSTTWGQPAQNRLGEAGGPGTPGYAVEGTITFRSDVFSISGGSYSYTGGLLKDCMIDPVDPANGVISGGTMLITDGVGSAIVPVPAALANSTATDAAGVCVDAFWVVNTAPTHTRAITMAPLYVL